MHERKPEPFLRIPFGERVAVMGFLMSFEERGSRRAAKFLGSEGADTHVFFLELVAGTEGLSDNELVRGSSRDFARRLPSGVPGDIMDAPLRVSHQPPRQHSEGVKSELMQGLPGSESGVPILDGLLELELPMPLLHLG